MSNLSLSTFTNSEFGSVRTIIENGKPLFAGVDIAKSLGYKNTRDAINRHCRCVVKRDGVSNTTNQHGALTEQLNEMSFISEGDIYRLVARSKLPSAERFESWIFDEVLPQIRKTGGYIPLEDDDTDEAIIAKALVVADKTIKKQRELIGEMTPKAEAYDTFLNTSGHQSFNKVAKSLGVGRNKMLHVLRNRAVLFKEDGSNIPYQRYINSGYFIVKEMPGRDGMLHTTTRVSARGVDFIRRELLKSEINCKNNKQKQDEVA